MQPDDGNRRPRTSAGVLFQRTADSVVLLDSRGGEYFSLDEVGARIWELCDGSRSVGDIASLIQDEYDVDADTIMTDLAELLAQLFSARLITYDA